jgi:Cof subfamily protein (haloacid dehalogenase superfamily)
MDYRSGGGIADVTIRLVISDVDGTLVTPEKELTPRTRTAVRKLREAGIAFTITSGRPPMGMKMLVDALELTDPLAAFNGGVLVRPDLTTLCQSFIPEAAAGRLLTVITAHGLDCWLYTDQDWFVRDPHGPHVAQEQLTVRFAPKVAPDFGPHLHSVAKLVGVSDDHDAIAACERELQHVCGTAASATLSQPYYLDVTPPDANKGHVVEMLSAMLDIPFSQIATIGDMPNDVLMFRKSGISIAMGNASEEVQREAQFVTASNQADGFAKAMEEIILRQAERKKAS